MGKTSTRGHKGQKARAGGGPHRAFEGGQSPLTKKFPKRGFINTKFGLEFAVLNLKDLQLHFDMGRLQLPEDGSPITVRTLVQSGIITRVRDGVKLLGAGGATLTTPFNIEVTRASSSAIEAIERVGGTIVTKHHNSLALRALLHPEKFHAQPKVARPPPRLMPYYLDYRNRGYLAPEVQLSKQLRRLGLSTC